jgi:glycosyltransferase involved in cell wall biosynthesis
LVGVISTIIYLRIRFGIHILYYPPAGPNLVPLLRDIAILLSTRWMFAKTVYHFHACGLSELIAKLPLPLKWLARGAMSRPEAAIQLSELTTPDAAALEAQHIFTVPNAAHDEARRLNFSPRLRPADSLLKVLYLGTVCEGKGVLVLLDACADAIAKGSRVQLDIVGSFQPSEFREQVENRIRSAGMHAVVRLWGQQTGEDKWKRFSEADVFCFPSHYQSEGFPCVLLEAMCFSLPVISTLWRGIPSIVEHGKTGFLIAPHDHSQLSDYLQSLAGDAALCLKLGMAGRERFSEHFTVEKYVMGLRQAFIDVGHS